VTVDRRIAIIGMSGRFPGAPDLDRFWANLAAGVESIVELNEDALRAVGVPEIEYGRPDYVPAAAPLADHDCFDAAFFGYTPREAEVMDPQHRIFLESAWHALEHAGHTVPDADVRVGVFGGAGSNGYLQHVYTNPDIVDAVGRTQVLLGNEIGFLAPRVAYKLDLTGPAISLRTACSTSLVALHLAIRALRDAECELAIAGGVFVNLEQNTGYRSQDGGFLSPDGHCRPFDADAAGTVFGSGVVVVVLKPLAAALADRDTVHAVLLGSAVNNDGAAKVGFTAPAVVGQVRVITAALRDAGLDAASIDYVEAHGTGTALGDPIEFQALVQAYAGPRDRPCRLGSVKSNIGHLDAASGMAGLLKIVLALQHEVVPATVHFRSPNPAVPLAESDFEVSAQSTPWPRTQRPRRAALSAFGFGGTNAHIVIEEPPTPQPSPASDVLRESELLILSARTSDALETATDRLANYLRRPDSAPLADVAATLGRGRQAFESRRALVAIGTADAAAALETREVQSVWTRRMDGGGHGVVFLLSGQGSQHPNMARELYEQEPTFRTSLDECLALLRERCADNMTDAVRSVRNLLTTMLPDRDTDFDAAAATLRQTAVAQPALFCIEYALARMWQSWDITPSALLGHSLGELTAACLAGVFDLGDALSMVSLRGRLMQACPQGAMLSVAAARRDVVTRLPQGVTIAAHNGARDCVVSGPADEIARLAETLQAQGMSTHEVSTSHAFHSPLMAPTVDPLIAAVASMSLHEPSIPIVSNVTGDWLTAEQATDPQYWGRHVLAPVQFSAGLDTVLASNPVALLEIGPGQVLAGLARRALATGSPVTVAASLPHPRQRLSALAATQRALGQLWAAGATPDWDAYYGLGRRRVPLPTYPFARDRFWLDLHLNARPAAANALVRQPDPADWFRVPAWMQQPTPVQPIAVNDRWLVFADEHGLGEALVARLRELGASVDVARVGASFARERDGYRLRPDSLVDHEQLVKDLTGNAAAPIRIVHCWNVTGVGAGPAAADVELPRTSDATRATAFDALLALAKAWPPRTPTQVWVVTDGLHRITGTETVAPVKALVLGPCRVLPREHPHTSWAAVDLDVAACVDADTSHRLLVECSSAVAAGTIAYRARQRWIQGWARHPLPSLPARPVVTMRGRTVLITGGLGAVGLALARHIAGPGTRLVLIGRRRLPAPAAWDAVAAGSGRDATTVQQLRCIEDLGAQLLVCRADVADVQQLRAVIASAVSRFGAVDAIVHAAGLPGGGLAEVKELDQAHAVMRPKIDGLLALDVLLQPGGPASGVDTLVLIGSNAGNVGDFGQIDYAAANTVLDAYAHATNGRRRVLTLDYASWRRAGMAVDTPVPEVLAEIRRNDLKVRGMEPEEALDALDRVLAWTDAAQIAVVPVDLDSLIASSFRLSGESDEFVGLRDEKEGPRHPRPALASGYVAPRTPTERTLCDTWADQLGLDRVGAQDSFFDLGGNSLIALSLIDAANNALDTRLTVARLYEALTVAGLAAIVDGSGTTVPDRAAPHDAAAGTPLARGGVAQSIERNAAGVTESTSIDQLDDRRQRAAARREQQRRRASRGR